MNQILGVGGGCEARIITITIGFTNNRRDETRDAGGVSVNGERWCIPYDAMQYARQVFKTI